MKKEPVVLQKIVKIAADHKKVKDDLITVEEPMEIRIVYYENGEPKEKSISVTMRTPGNDFELAVGFLFTEKIIKDIHEIKSIRYCQTDKELSQGNIVKVILKRHIAFDSSHLNRNFYMTSSCGICGKASIENVAVDIPHHKMHFDIPESTFKMMYQMAEKLRSSQTIFKYTGSIHAAGLFDFKGNLMMSFEDVGRHNALDKLIGAAVIKSMLPLHEYCIIISGRIGFELVQKSVMTSIGVVGAVGAPSNLAIRLAREHRMTLIGFIKEKGYNIYSNIADQQVSIPIGFEDKINTH